MFKICDLIPFAMSSQITLDIGLEFTLSKNNCNATTKPKGLLYGNLFIYPWQDVCGKTRVIVKVHVFTVSQETKRTQGRYIDVAVEGLRTTIGPYDIGDKLCRWLSSASDA